VENSSFLDDSSIQSGHSNDSLEIGRSIIDNDDDSLKTENVRIIEPKPKPKQESEPEPVKQPDVSVEVADDESIEGVPI
jgi:hypothetical protein